MTNGLSALHMQVRALPPSRSKIPDGTYRTPVGRHCNRATAAPEIQRKFPQRPAEGRLDEEHYPQFLAGLTNVRPPLLELASDDAEDDEYVPRIDDERPIITQQIRGRRGARQFREGLLARFNATCLVTGCQVTDLLEAAHICPHRGAKDDHLQNGLLLRSDIHTLFDLHLLAIEPDQLRVDINPKLKEDEYYGDLDGKLLTVTNEARPSRTSLGGALRDVSAEDRQSLGALA